MCWLPVSARVKGQDRKGPTCIQVTPFGLSALQSTRLNKRGDAPDIASTGLLCSLEKNWRYITSIPKSVPVSELMIVSIAMMD